MSFIKIQSLRSDAIFIIYAALSLIGPIGLILGTKFLLRGPHNIRKMVKSLLSILAMGIITAGIVAANFITIATEDNIRLDNSWSVIVLIFLMPAMALFHMIYLSQQSQQNMQQAQQL